MATRGAHGKAARVATFQEAVDADAPSVCSRCLGSNEVVQVLKHPPQGGGPIKKCHNCSRPYTAFSWRAAVDSRVRATVLCRECAALKNCCQCCLCDLATGLSMSTKAKMTPEEIAAVAAAKQSRTLEEELELLKKQEVKNTNRFEQKVCTFFAKGFCSRGAACPFRHLSAAEIEAEKEKAMAKKKALDEAENLPSAMNPSSSGSTTVTQGIKDRFAKLTAATGPTGGATAGFLQQQGDAAGGAPLMIMGAPGGKREREEGDGVEADEGRRPGKAAKKAEFDASWMGNLRAA